MVHEFEFRFDVPFVKNAYTLPNLPLVWASSAATAGLYSAQNTPLEHLYSPILLLARNSFL